MTIAVPVSVICEDPRQREAARQVAQQLQLPFETPAMVQLTLTPRQWILKQTGCLPIAVDFNPLAWRNTVTASDPLIRACRPGAGRLIVDLTAGLARDAAMLAAFGSTMHLVERDLIMQVLLADGLKRAEVSKEVSAGQVSLFCMDAMTYLEHPPCRPDVIYYDPMHPARVKAAKVNQALQCLKTWLQPEADPLPVLERARLVAKERVVFKWPAKAPILGQPNHQLIGKTIRYDVYLPHATLK